VIRVLSTAALALALAACATETAPLHTEAPAPTRAVAPLPQEADAYFAAAAARAARAPTARARNVILFIGDGMGVATVTAARIYAGQSQGQDGESYELTLDTFPHLALSRTYSHDFQISDSAATTTAMTTGVKTRSGMLGVMSAAELGNCASAQGQSARTLFEMAEEAGLATGIVSTARITHATPAATYAHIPHRNWESDADMPADAAACPDIARQLVEWPAGDGFEIAMGGGRRNFLPATMADPEAPDVLGRRLDGRDLAAEWAAKPGHVLVWNAAQFAAVDFASDVRILGLFSPSHMAYESQRADDSGGGEPSLAEMTAAAITRLSQEPDGYVLMVEGGRIDHAHHEGRAGEALSETVAFDAAIRRALEMTSRDDTLIVATADHSHVLTIAGYAARGNPILGISVGDAGAESPRVARDGRPYTTLGYMNGPGAAFDPARPDAAHSRADLSDVDTADLGFHQQALVPLQSETHGGEDVPFYAWGPGADGFAGTIEQNVSFHLMARALGLR
jgi:alkaline phosphatase